MQDSSSLLPASDSTNHNDGIDMHQLAIDAALNCEWKKAEDLNRKLIKEDPSNVACLNRLARALFELEKYAQVKKICEQVLELDPYNTIAQKNLKKVVEFKKANGKAFRKKDKDFKDAHSVNFLSKLFLGKKEEKTNGETQTLKAFNTPISPSPISPFLFLEEAGITKVVNLIKLAEPQKLSKLYPGSMVKLIAKNRGISITDLEDNYLGVLADDISHLLIRLIKGGNQYSAIIKSVKPNSLSILVREIFRSKKFKNQPSFIEYSKVSIFSSDHITFNLDEEAEDSQDNETEEV